MWFALLMRLASRIHEPLVAARKQALLSRLSGPVLELGPGDGVNFRYYPPGLLWTGYEPNRWLARRIPLPAGATLHTSPYTGQPGAYDAIVSTLVLCSVPDPAATLAHLYRSLKPGGSFIFLEHVAAPAGSPLRARQDRLLPLWRCCAGGCHPNRDTEALIRAAGFDIHTIERFHLPLSLASPHILGVATRS